VNDPAIVCRAEIIREKGTDRSRFFRGEVDKYTWQEAGSSFLPGELIAAFLWAQLEEADTITRQRLESWWYYHSRLASLEEQGVLRRPVVPPDCQHNAHMYYVLLPDEVTRDLVLASLKNDGVNAVFHYLPLHSSPGGIKHARIHGSVSTTTSAAARILRLPLWIGISHQQIDYVVAAIERACTSSRKTSLMAVDQRVGKAVGAVKSPLTD